MPSTETGGSRNSRADTVRRWATEGARAYTSIQGQSVYVSDRPNTILDGGSWFGVNKRYAGYTPEATMAILENQIGVEIRKEVTLAIIGYYRKHFCTVNMTRACQILTALGCADDTFYWGYNNSWTPREILQDMNSVNAGNTVHCWLAKDMHIQFVGGPPNKWNIFNGTLLSMMIDRIAVVVLLEGTSALKNLHGIWETHT